MPNKKNSEKREKIRVDFSAKIVLKIGSSEILVDGSSKDMSLSGIYVNTNENIPLGTKCIVEVHLSGMTDDFSLQIHGRVARLESKGIAITFESMDLDSYTHLKNIVKYNTTNPDDIF